MRRQSFRKDIAIKLTLSQANRDKRDRSIFTYSEVERINKNGDWGLLKREIRNIQTEKKCKETSDMESRSEKEKRSAT